MEKRGVAAGARALRVWSEATRGRWSVPAELAASPILGRVFPTDRATLRAATMEPKDVTATKFTTELAVRPDDIDMNQHVHNSRYFDYVLAARYDQMRRCYGMPMEEFLARGFGWVVKVAHLIFKRPLNLGDTMVITTWIAQMCADGVQVQFTIAKKENGKLCCDGYFDYTMISLASGRAAIIPEEIRQRYSV
jgi:acyl-CoA thioester hydrolase/thioesterase-3